MQFVARLVRAALVVVEKRRHVSASLAASQTGDRRLGSIRGRFV